MHSLLSRQTATRLASIASTSQVRLEMTVSRIAAISRCVNSGGRNLGRPCMSIRNFNTTRTSTSRTLADLTEAQDDLLHDADATVEGEAADLVHIDGKFLVNPTASDSLDLDKAAAAAAEPPAIPVTSSVSHSKNIGDACLLSPMHPHTSGTVQRQLKEIEKAKSVVASHAEPHPHLPPPEEWAKQFPRVSGFQRSNRWFLCNNNTCKSVVQALKLDEYVREQLSPGEKMTIIEGYPGPGIMTRAFLESDAVDKVIAMEDNAYFFQGLKNLQQDPGVRDAASRLQIAYRSAYNWESYDDLLNAGQLDSVPGLADRRHGRTSRDPSVSLLEDELWKRPSPILFVAQLPNLVHSEQLLSQLLRGIANRLWLFRYSRVRIALLCSEQLATRLVAQSGKLRGKVTLIADAQAEVQILQGSSSFAPHHEHCWPPVAAVGVQLPMTKRSSTIRAVAPTTVATRKSTGAKLNQALVLIEPKVKPLIVGADMDAYDYITKHLLVLRSQPLRKALLHLAPGAENLIGMLESGNHPALQDLGPVRIDPDQKVNTLPLTHFVALARIFERWPFRPVYLFDEGRLEDIRD